MTTLMSTSNVRNGMSTVNQQSSGKSGRRGRNGNRTVVAVDGTLPPLPSSQSELLPKQTNSSRRRRRRGPRNKLTQYLMVSDIPNSTRSGLSPNPADPRTTITRQLGQTPLGAGWCLKVLHPNGEHDSRHCKVPDGSASESVILERRDEFTVSVPSAITTGNWTVVLIQHPYLSQSLLAIAGNPNLMTDANIQTTYAVAYRSPSVIASSPAYSTTAVTGGNLFVSFLDMSVLDDRTLENSGADNYWDGFFKTIRRTYCGLTVDFDANDLTNSGRITSGQFQDVVADRTLAATAGGTIEQIVNVYQVQSLPVVPEDIVQQDILCRQAEAKTGEYAPQRFWQPTIDFVPSTSARNIHIITATDDDEPVAAADQPKTIFFAGWGVYVTRFADINVTSSLRIKRKEGLELVVGRASPYGPFNEPGYPKDLRALTIASEFARTEPHAYEADYNSKNLMSKGIFSTLGNILGGLGLPLISDIAPSLGGILDGLLGGVL